MMGRAQMDCLDELIVDNFAGGGVIILPNGGRASAREILTALVEDAHRRGVSYGELTASLDGFTRERIVWAWWTFRRAAALREAPREDPGEACSGFRYWRPASATSGVGIMMCCFLVDTGRARRRTEAGECLEFEEVTEIE